MEADIKPGMSWSSTNYPLQQQFDAWYDVFNQAAHAEWSFAAPGRPHFNGKLQQRQFGDIHLINCWCDPMTGRRTRRQIAQSNGAYYGIILVQQGDELLRCGENDFRFCPGDIFLWDTTRPAEFEILSRYQKVSLIVPQDHLKRFLPNVDLFLNKKIKTQHGLGAVVAAHLTALGQNILTIGSIEGKIAFDLSLELVITYLRSLQIEPDIAYQKPLFLQIKKYIHQNFDNPNLSPAYLAKEHSISVRYLHQLFQATGTSVSQLILQRRLEQCRRDLLQITNDNSITEIAFRWGFSSAAYFSRAFRQQYGQSPSQYRKTSWGK